MIELLWGFLPLSGRSTAGLRRGQDVGCGGACARFSVDEKVRGRGLAGQKEIVATYYEKMQTCLLKTLQEENIKYKLFVRKV